ncbi:MAG TPA: MoaD/ThiS family protein [Acidimicrobiales bacterium]|nr:MoaD/ThiS family protein [Acidimicrobiales bacterium]
MFAAAREAAGTTTVDVPGATVGDVLDAAVRQFGPVFASVLATAAVWRNGEPSQPADRVGDDDEVAVLPPVSGGAAADPVAAASPVVLPRGRLGAAWTVTAVASAILGTAWLAAWLALTAVVAAVQTIRREDGSAREADTLLALGITVALAASAVFGVWPLVVTATVIAIGVGGQRVLALNRVGRHAAPPKIDLGRPIVVGALCGLAAAGPVVARVSGLPEALAVLGLVAAYDAGSFVVGTGAVNDWEGPAAGVASVAAGTLAVAALCVPPFHLPGVTLLGLVVACGGPAGAYAARRLSGVPRVVEDATRPRVSMLYRLSTLLVVGPIVASLLGLLTAD